jgi:hypothetical protein
VLTELWLSDNNIGRRNAGGKAVRDAVKDRNGFELHL